MCTYMYIGLEGIKTNIFNGDHGTKGGCDSS